MRMLSKLFFFPLLLGLLAACQTGNPDKSQDPPLDSPSIGQEEAPEKGYDAEKAAQYGADEYGMKKYVMAFLKAGPKRDLDSLKAAELQAAHMENIGRMAEEGKLVLAGPFFGDGELRGIYVFDVPSIAEAEALTKSDPAIQAGSLKMELVEWYGSAALMEVNEIHMSLAKENP